MKGKSIYQVRNVENLKDLLDQSANLYENNIAFKVKIKETSQIRPILYKEYKEEVDALGTALIKYGLKGQKIAVISENRYEWTLSYFSVTNGTGIIVPLDKALPDIELEGLLLRSKASAIFFSEKYYDIMKQIEKRNHFIETFICMDQIEEDKKFKNMSTLIEEGRKLINNGDRKFIDAKIDNQKMGIMLFTSGTTEAAKAVMLSHKNICSDVVKTANMIKLYENDVFFSFLPLHHTYECTAGFLRSIYSGCSTVYCEGLKHITENLQEYKPSIMISVPLILENIHKKMWESARKKGSENKLKLGIKINKFLQKYLRTDASKLLFSEIHKTLGGNMRIIISGAASLDQKVQENFRTIGIKLLQGYGLTETSPIISVENDKHKRIGSSGKPMADIEIKIEDAEDDGIGEIVVKSDVVMLGYYENEEETKKVLKKGWFYTGDLGKIDKDGYLYVTGRKKSVIVQKNGKNIYPEEIEILINKIPYVKESIVFGKTTKQGDLDICAKVVYEKDNPVDDIEKFINDNIKKINKTMPIYKYIREVTVTDKELKKTTTQKIKRHLEIESMLKK